MTDDAATQHFSVDPSPPCKGQPVEICYAGTPAPEAIEYTIGPDGDTVSVTLGPDGKATVDMPDDATSLNVHDPSGASIDLNVPVVAC